MTKEVGRENEPIALTEQAITKETGFKLRAFYPGFAEDGSISPSVPDDYQDLCERFGYENIILSLYKDADSSIQLGIFAKLPDS